MLADLVIDEAEHEILYRRIISQIIVLGRHCCLPMPLGDEFYREPLEEVILAVTNGAGSVMDRFGSPHRLPHKAIYAFLQTFPIVGMPLLSVSELVATSTLAGRNGLFKALRWQINVTALPESKDFLAHWQAAFAAVPKFHPRPQFLTHIQSEPVSDARYTGLLSNLYPECLG